MSKIRISLIIANIILGFAIYLSFKGENKQRESFNEVLISTLSNLDSVRLESGNASKVINLSKVSSNWMITEPYEWQINKLTLSNFQTKVTIFLLNLFCNCLKDLSIIFFCSWSSKKITDL